MKIVETKSTASRREATAIVTGSHVAGVDDRRGVSGGPATQYSVSESMELGPVQSSTMDIPSQHSSDGELL